MSPVLTTELGVPVQVQPRPFCPDCGEAMYLRRPRPGGNLFEPFWGCALYPACTGTRNINPHTGEPFEDDDTPAYDPPFTGVGYGEGGRIRSLTNRETGVLEGWHCTNCDKTWKVARSPKHLPGCEIGEADKASAAEIVRRHREAG